MARSKCCTVFGSGCDGAVPCAGLIDVDGILYGTTAYGGDVTYRSGLGTVFRISTTGKEQVLHNFGVSDGANTPQRPRSTRTKCFMEPPMRAGRTVKGRSLTWVEKGRSRCCIASRGRTPHGARTLAALVEGAGVFYGTTESAARLAKETVLKIASDRKRGVCTASAVVWMVRTPRRA